jgi:DNA replication protein DnaC
MLRRALRKLDSFEVLILDDLGYVKQHPDEAEVLFTLIAERYEHRSIIVTSNVVFSQWDQIFQSPMATAAAIDRIVHHSVILEFDVPSYRTDQARERTATPQEGKEESKRQTGGRNRQK